MDFKQVKALSNEEKNIVAHIKTVTTLLFADFEGSI
jgi:hypothetical protein